jgi:putative nucleotide binding protein
MEEYVYVIDVIPYSNKYKGQSYGIGLGEKFFTLLEMTFKKDANLPNIGDKIYVGKVLEKRTVVDKIKRKLSYNELTNVAKDNIKNVLKKLIIENEQRFIDFINNSGPISARVHPLSLFPGVGKKTLEILLAEKEKQKFKSFEDIKERVSVWQDPVESIALRIIEEFEGKDKRKFFVL